MTNYKFIKNYENELDAIIFSNSVICFKYIDECVFIEKIIDNGNINSIIDRLICLAYNKYCFIKYKGGYNLSNYHFVFLDGEYILDLKNVKIKRFLEIGILPTGEKNNICDIEGVLVGQKSIKTEKYNTGVTVVKPHKGNIFKEKVVAGCHVHNGFGKSMGFVQINELGTIETNIAITGTLNIGKISDAVIEESLENNPEIGISTGTVNPIVLECNDSTLNDSRDRAITIEDYYEAINNFDNDFSQGAIGGGCGMVCHGFKGGIGSASRKITISEKEYTLGVMVNSNFGSGNGRDLIFNGVKLGKEIETLQNHEDKGSIIVLVVTDVPLDNRQLNRVVRRCSMGISRTGSFAGNGSGDVFVGFTTANKVCHFVESPIDNINRLSDNYINSCFRACVEATEEAILNSMLFSVTTKGSRNKILDLRSYFECIIDLLNPEIIFK